MFFKGKNVLVTGGSGFIGSQFVNLLLEQDANVHVPIHNRGLLTQDDRVVTLKADLLKQEDCDRIVKDIDYVFNLAGAVAAAAITTTNPMDAIVTNLVLTSRMLQAAWKGNVKGIQIYGSHTGYPSVNYPIKEEEMWKDEPHPVYFGYGWMRRYLEIIGKYVGSKTDIKISIVRPTAVYGPRDNFDIKTGHVIPALIARAVEKENPYVVWGTGDEVRDFLHVKDFALGCLLLMEKGKSCEPINIGYGSGVTIRETAEIILKATGHDNAELVFDATKPTTIPIRVVDTSKAKKRLGFKPDFTFEEGIQDTVDWYLKNIVKKEVV